MSAPLDFELKRPASFVQVVVAVFSRPRTFFAEMPQTGWLPPLAFLVVLHLLAALSSLGVALSSPGGMATWGYKLLTNLINAYIFASILYWVTRLVAKTADFSMTGIFRVFAYGTSVWLATTLAVFLAPGLQLILFAAVGLVSLYLIFVGLQVVARLTVPLAAASLLITVVAVLLLMVALAQIAAS